jgi:hypothetical protein
LAELAECLFRYLDEVRGLEEVESTLLGDWYRDGARRERLPFMRERALVGEVDSGKGSVGGAGKRQRRHAVG